MNFLQRWAARFAGTAPSGPLDDYWYEPRSGPATAGVSVDPTSAVGVTTVSACVKVIAETVATVPLLLYRETPDGRDRATDHPLYALLRRRPNRWQTSLDWRAMLTGHAALRGRAYAEMIGRTRADLEIIPRHPDRVRILEADSAGFPVTYGVRDAQTAIERPVPAARMFTLCGPWGGRSPIEAHRDAIGLGIAMQQQAGRFFGNGSRPGGLLKSPAGVTFSPEQRAAIKQSWEEAHRGPALSHRVAVLEGGLEWQDIGTTPEDSQFIQSRMFQVVDLCRIWGVPPYKVHEYGRATWGNTEQMAIDFLAGCMLPWFRRWEEAIAWYLIEDSEGVFAEFLVDGLLRGDIKSRYEAYAIAVTNGIMTRNEVRKRENLNRLPGLDEPLTPTTAAQPGSTPPPPPPNTPPADQSGQDEGVGGGGDGSGGGAASALWESWAHAAAEALVAAELRAIERVDGLAARDPAAFADWARAFYLGKHREYVAARLGEMAGVWRGALPLGAAVAAIAAAGPEWAIGGTRDASARHLEIKALLTERTSHDRAA